MEIVIMMFEFIVFVAIVIIIYTLIKNISDLTNTSKEINKKLDEILKKLNNKI
jgi:uncharacterized membrane protein